MVVHCVCILPFTLQCRYNSQYPHQAQGCLLLHIHMFRSIGHRRKSPCSIILINSVVVGLSNVALLMDFLCIASNFLHLFSLISSFCMFASMNYIPVVDCLNRSFFPVLFFFFTSKGFPCGESKLNHDFF